MSAVKRAMFIQKYSHREEYLHYFAIFFIHGKNLKLTGFMQRQCWQPQKMGNSKAEINLQK
jgi:hypothetical protein